ncbi:MAG: hypothetical protein JZU55_10455, partial [Afipia sp.]|nr:hypothetical protein [Afipia sp.]
STTSLYGDQLRIAAGTGIGGGSGATRLRTAVASLAAQTAVGDIRLLNAGALHIGLYVSPSTGQLRTVLHEYKNAFPNVDVQYVEGERSLLMERLNAGSIDVAIVVGHFRSGMHDIVPLWSEKILVAMAATHSLADKATLTWDDLRTEHILL